MDSPDELDGGPRHDEGFASPAHRLLVLWDA